MEEQIVTITIRTAGQTCEMRDEEIVKWYESHISGLFDPAYGTPQITVTLQRRPL